MHSHLTGYMSQDFVPIIKLYPEHGIGQRLYYRSLNLYRLFFWHKSSHPEKLRAEKFVLYIRLS